MKERKKNKRDTSRGYGTLRFGSYYQDDQNSPSTRDLLQWGLEFQVVEWNLRYLTLINLYMRMKKRV